MTTFENMPCSNTEACKNHDTKDAPEFSYHERMFEAEVMVKKMLNNDPVEALEMLSGEGEDSFDNILKAVSCAIQDNHLLLSRLNRLAADKYADDIQEKLERE